MTTRSRNSWAVMMALLMIIMAILPKTASSQSVTQTPATNTPATVSTLSATSTSGAISTLAATNTPSAANTATSPVVTATPTVTGTLTSTLVPVPVTAIQNQVPRTVSVSGRGRVDGQPDMAVISLGVRTEDENAADALSQNNTQMQSLISALRNGGVAQADIRTLTIQLYPRYQPPPASDPGGPVVVNGFIATNMVEVTVRDLDNLGVLLDDAVQAGGNQVEGIRFDISDQSALLDEAREAAMQDARHKAEQLANLSGARLGVVMTIIEASSTPVPFLRELSAQAADSSVPVSPGMQTIDVTIQVTWELQ
jgi:uncharacterized protein